MTDVATIVLKADSTGIRVAYSDLEKLSTASAQAEKSTNALTASSIKLSSVVQGIAGSYAALRLAGYIKEAALLNARFETMGVVMNVVGKNAGYSSVQMREYELALRSTGISMVEARETLSRMAQAQLDMSKSTELARIAQNAAVIGQINSSEAFQRMIYGIQSGQTEILRTIGINVNFEESYSKLAKQLGISTKQLDETQKAAARLNAVMEYGPRIAGVYEQAMGTAGKQLLSMQRYADDVKVKLGEVFNETLTAAVFGMAGGFSDLNKELDELSREKQLDEWGQGITDVLANIADALYLAGGAIKIFATALVIAAAALKEQLKGNFSEARTILEEFGADVRKYADNIGAATRYVENMRMMRERAAERDKNAAILYQKDLAYVQKRYEGFPIKVQQEAMMEYARAYFPWEPIGINPGGNHPDRPTGGTTRTRTATDPLASLLSQTATAQLAEFRKMVDLLNKRFAPTLAQYGYRDDGTPKGAGYLGPLTIPGTKKTVTEYTVGVNINGEEMDIPTLVPTLAKEEVDKVLAAAKQGILPPQDIIDKAIEFAKKRLGEGKSVFASTGTAPAQYNEAMEILIKKQFPENFAKAEEEAAQAARDRTEWMDQQRGAQVKATDAYWAWIEATNADIKASDERAKRMEYEIELLGLTAEEREEALKMYDIEIAYKKKLADLDALMLDQESLSYQQRKQQLEAWKASMIQAVEDEKVLKAHEKTAAQMQKIWDNFVENVQRSMGDQLYNILQGKFDNIGDAFKSMIDRMVADAMAAKLSEYLFGEGGPMGKSSWLGGFVNNLFGTGGSIGSLGAGATESLVFATGASAAASALPGLDMVMGAMLHSGGTVGGTSVARAVPASVFSGAERFHSGGTVGAQVLYSGGVVGAATASTTAVEKTAVAEAERFHDGGLLHDEVPIIAKRGELVLTEAQQRAIAPVLAEVLHDGGLVGTAAREALAPARAFVDAPRFHAGGVIGDIAGIGGPVTRTNKTTANRDRSGNMIVNMTVVTKDSSSFKASEGQITAQAARMLSRAKRNM